MEKGSRVQRRRATCKLRLQETASVPLQPATVTAPATARPAGRRHPGACIRRAGLGCVRVWSFLALSLTGTIEMQPCPSPCGPLGPCHHGPWPRCSPRETGLFQQSRGAFSVQTRPTRRHWGSGAWKPNLKVEQAPGRRGPNGRAAPVHFGLVWAL